MWNLETSSDKDIALDSLFLLPQNIDEIFASVASGQQWRILSLVLLDFLDDADGTIYRNVNDEARSLATELNLCSISEEWIGGL